jgi:hypothetical protein
MRFRVRGFIWLIILSLLPWSAVKAVEENRIYLFAPNLKEFPVIQFHTQVFDANGSFIQDLQTTDFSIVEDGITFPPISVEENHPGAQLAIVLNPGDSFTIRNAQGINRYQIILDELKRWSKDRQGSTIDDISLLYPGDSPLRHTEDPQQLSQVLEKVPFSNDPLSGKEFTPNLDSIFQAVELVVDEPERLGMGKGVLLITAPIAEENRQSIENLAARAQEVGVRLMVWMVGAAEGPNVREAEILQNLALSTGGNFFVFTGEEAFPDIEGMIEPLRQVYEIRYLSQIRSSGIHQLVVQAQTTDGLLVSNAINFEINLLPPVPMFILPPVEIQRLPPDLETDRPEQIPVTAYQPTSQEMPILIDFPDGYQRGVTRTALFVDGVVEQENTVAPFDQFVWDLSQYTTDGNHVLRAEAEDNLGLTGSSIEITILVKVVRPKFSPERFITKNLVVLGVTVVLLIGAVVFLALVFSGRVKPFQPGRGRFKRHKPGQDSPPEAEPDKKPSKRSERKKSAWLERFTRQPRSNIVSTHAYLTPIKESGKDDNQGRKAIHSPPIPITANEVIFGSDPGQATILLEDPAVEGRHARLVRLPDESYQLFDEGSIAGTWVNYIPVPPSGLAIEHGDVIHVGRAVFRFTLRKPKKVRKPVVRPAQNIGNADQGKTP